jgi:dTDP-4-amino-4,6-dideoxygalactose transaminase
VWAQYTLRVAGLDRDQFQADLKSKGVPTAVYYPRPLHQQTAYRHYPAAGNGLPVSERLASEVVSLPMHPYLTEEVQDRVIAAVKDAMVGQRRVAAE